MAKTAADRLYSKTGVKPTDVDVVELHDCFSANELITYEALGLCEVGKAGEFIDRGQPVGLLKKKLFTYFLHSTMSMYILMYNEHMLLTMLRGNFVCRYLLVQYTTKTFFY